MQAVNISLPEPLKQFVDSQIASGRYGSVSEYIRALIRDDEKRNAGRRLDALLVEGPESEESELTEQDFKEIRQEALAQAKRQAESLQSLNLPITQSPDDPIIR
jgi:antitoxin ParD1/3/4